jgi:hypothetical protein
VPRRMFRTADRNLKSFQLFDGSQCELDCRADRHGIVRMMKEASLLASSFIGSAARRLHASVLSGARTVRNKFFHAGSH